MTMFWYFLGFGLLALAALAFTLALCKAGSDADDALATLTPERPAQASVARRKHEYPIGPCPVCGALGVCLRLDGAASRRWHRCPPTYSQEELAAIMTGSEPKEAA
jgi:hypothetical protein